MSFLVRTVSLCILLSFFSVSVAFSQGHIDFEFGPSPRSNDFHVMFNDAHDSKWGKLHNSVRWFNFHQMSYLRKVGLPTDSGDSSRLNVSNNAYLSGSEALKAAEMLSDHSLKASATISNGLSYGNVCRDYKNATSAGRAAADFDFNQLSTLRNALWQKSRSRIERIYIDGPFLRVLKFAKKAYSCANFNHNGLGQVLAGSGRSPSGSQGAVKVVHEYIKRLSERFPDTQIFITLNIVNWRQENIGPTYGTWAYKLEDVLGLFLSSSFYDNGKHYTINGFQFDAPYSVVSSNINQFKRRIKLVTTQLENRISNFENMGFSFYVNTEDHYKFDNRLSSKGFYHFRSDKKNKNSATVSRASICNLESNLVQRQKCYISDGKYFEESRRYANELRTMIRNDSFLSKLNSVTFTYGSWHVSPSKSVWGSDSYMDFLIEEIPRIRNY